jgi:hypothetical protein
MGQRTDDVLLANQRFKVPGTVFAGEDLIGHTAILPYTAAIAATLDARPEFPYTDVFLSIRKK